MVIGLTGDFHTADALRLLKRSFGDWPRGGGAPRPPEPAEAKPAAGIYFTEKDDVNQANVGPLTSFGKVTSLDIRIPGVQEATAPGPSR